MIQNSFLRQVPIKAEEGINEYPFGIRIPINNWAEGSLVFYVNRLVDVQNELILEGEWPDYSLPTSEYDPSIGYVLDFGNRNGTKGALIIKDVRNFFVWGGTDTTGYLWYRRIKFPTYGFANVDKNIADNYSYNINMYTPAIVGDIVDFSKFINVAILKLAYESVEYKSNVVGSLESFAEGCIHYGKTEGDIKVICNGHITYNNIVIPAYTEKTITFSGTSYTVA